MQNINLSKIVSHFVQFVTLLCAAVLAVKYHVAVAVRSHNRRMTLMRADSFEMDPPTWLLSQDTETFVLHYPNAKIKNHFGKGA